MSFFDWLMSHREKKDELQVLAAQFSALSHVSRRVRNVDSFSDLVEVFQKYPCLRESISILPATVIGLWMMYCSSCGHPL